MRTMLLGSRIRQSLALDKQLSPCIPWFRGKLLGEGCKCSTSSQEDRSVGGGSGGRQQEGRADKAQG